MKPIMQAAEAGVSETQAGAHAEALRAAFADGVATGAHLRAETTRLEAGTSGVAAKVERLDAKIGVMRRALGFIALPTPAMAARLFGVV